MTRKMLQFIRLHQQAPDKRAAAERTGDFDEISVAFDEDRAGNQASRCEHCMKVCLTEKPPYFELSPGHYSACWLQYDRKGR